MKNSNTVAAERRMDLASLFCMIGRHGPAVALAVIAMMSVLAGFVIYRTVRGKRRKATAAADDGDDQSPPGAERDASVIQPSPEEPRRSAESTDINNEGSDMKEAVDLIQSDLVIRHRRAAAAVAAAAEKKPSPYSPPNSNIQVPENKNTTSDVTEEMVFVRASHKVAETYAEEANQGDTYTVAKMVMKDNVDCHQGVTDDVVEDVIEAAHGNDSCLKEPEPINEEKVLKAECQEIEDVSTEKDVLDKKTRQEEENFLLCDLNNPVCFGQTHHMSERGDDDRLQVNKTTLETNSIESNSEEPAIYMEDVPDTCICYSKDEELEKEGEKNEDERAEEECVDNQVIAQQADVWFSTIEQEEETNLPSTQQDQCDHMTDNVVASIRHSDWDEDIGVAGEMIEEVVDKDHLNKPTAVGCDTHLPQFDEQEVAIKQKAENCLTCNEDDGVLYDCIDQERDRMLNSDSIVACSEECGSSSVALSCLSMPVKVDNHDNILSDITTDIKVKISGIADSPDLLLDCQQPQKEDKKVLSLDEDTDSTILGSQMSSHETKNQPENNKNGSNVMLADEFSDHVHDPHSESYKDQQSVQMIRNEAFEKGCVAANPDAVEITASEKVQEISFPHPPTIRQDEQSHSMENDETSDKTRVHSVSDTNVCHIARLTALLKSEEISHPDMLCSTQDQQSDHMNNNDFPEVTTSAAPPDLTEDINPPIYQIYLSSFEQSECRYNDLSPPAVGEESGISSMAVSPDFQDASYDVAIGNMVLPVIDCYQQAEGQIEAQNSLFADDVAVSVMNENTAGRMFGPYLSRHSQEPNCEQTDWAKYESFAANEDMFGHEIEDGYHKAMDQFMAQISASVTSFTDDLKIQTDMKAVIEVSEMKEKKAGLCVEKKKENKEEEEKEEDYEKTEISIMEATMDNNEWITESNYQVLPWLGLSASSFVQDQTKINQLPTEECQYISAGTDTTCIDTTDIPPSTEDIALSLVEENTENNKKVVAVQPMPQNVNVTFRVHYFTQSPYQTVAVTGNQQELGNWKGFIPLERAKDGHWATVVSLPAESNVEWKFVVLDKGEVCRWEECGNRLLDTGYGDDLLVHKWWGLL
ncbi:uncharacterized protein stbd1 [Larimichthys crocea]|uniref:uncharacterized protein stbd1 n=1 Tax=Larimichthys crocea TaxID=215358 RepID=UPI000F5E65DE|nr:starch-binding domain-containing protein 1 [Larimichthys crocea]XP_027134453.1 starch-binding domain-containing protein 1 [Larimichthys crocea]